MKTKSLGRARKLQRREVDRGDVDHVHIPTLLPVVIVGADHTLLPPAVGRILQDLTLPILLTVVDHGHQVVATLLFQEVQIDVGTESGR